MIKTYQDYQHHNFKLIWGMIQLKLRSGVKKQDVSFPEVWLQRGAAPWPCVKPDHAFGCFLSDICLHTCTQSLYSCPPPSQRAISTYSTLKGLNLEIKDHQKQAFTSSNAQWNLGWYTRKCKFSRNFPKPSRGRPSKGPSAAKGCSWSFKFWIQRSASVKEP